MRLVPILLLLAVGWPPAAPALAAGVPALGPVGPQPLAFEPNQGQADATVRFLARGRGYGVYLAPTETVLVLTPPPPARAVGRRPQPAGAEDSPLPAVVRMRLIGADAGAAISGVEPLPGRHHYLVGEPSQWRRDVPTFARVRYAEVYPGVSLVFYGSERQLEYDFVVAPGADPGAVALAFEGADALRVDDGGDLVLATSAGELRLRRPVVYQEAAGERRPVEGGYILEDGRVRFRVAAWDSARPLVIDPVLGYSTHLGGSSNDVGFGIAVDALGNAYVTGSTGSSNFPFSPTAFQRSDAGVTDVFVTKLSATGTQVYSTYLGGSGADVGHAIAVDTLGNAYVTGSTTSNNFPVAGAFGVFQSTTRGGSEAFISKLSPDGSTLVYSTYLGSNTDDFAFGIALDDLDRAYVTGSTQSASFPNNNAITCAGIKNTGDDAFVARLSVDGSTLEYCTFLGGGGVDVGNAIAADGTGNVWIAGSTTSTDLPVFNAIQPGLGGGMDGFVASLDTNGLLVYLTFLGGNADDEALAIAVDGNKSAFITGSTASRNFPVTSTLQPVYAGGATDAFVTKLDVNGDLVFSTFLGGSGNDIGNAIAIHVPESSIYVAGSTNSLNFPVVRALQGPAGGLDAFVTKLMPAGDDFVASTYLGGAADDAAQAIAVDTDGVAYVTGSTSSLTFPTVAPLQGPGGVADAFVSQIVDGSLVQFSATTFQVAENAGTATIQVQRTGDTAATASVAFATSDGTAVAGTDYQSTSGTLTFGPGQTVKTITVPVIDNASCDGNRAFTLTLSSPSASVTLGSRSTATVTIVDDEPAIAFSAPTYSVGEGDGSAMITVTRSGNLVGTAFVNFSTSNGTATAGSDYTAPVPNPRTLTFLTGASSQTVAIPIINDTLAEPDETVNLTLAGASGGSPAVCLGRTSAVLTIVDNDPAGALAFSRSSFTVNEPAPGGMATATITVTRTVPAGTTAGGGVTVDYAVSDNTAVAGTNYTATSGTLSFAAGQTSRSFTVPIRNDATSTGNLLANLALTNPQPAGVATLGGLSAATLTIVDREPNVGFSASTYTVREGVTSAVITVKRGGSTTQAFTVDFATSAGADFGPASGTLTFSAGVTSRTYSVPVVRVNDKLASPPSSVMLTLSNVVLLSGVGAPAIVGTNPATLTIVDDDVAGSVQLSRTSYMVNEPGSGTVNAVITVTRTGGAAAGVMVDYAVSDNTAVAGTNYTATAGTLTFGAGQTSLTFAVPILHDPTPSGNLVATITLSNATSQGGGAVTLGSPSTAPLTIVDFEPSVTFSAPAYSVVEGTPSASITVRRAGTASVPFTVDFATSNGTGTAGTDYQTVTTTLNFAAGTASRSVSVPIVNNTVVVGPRTVTLTLSNPSASVRIAAPNPATLTIGEDDLGGTLQFSAATYTMREPAGAPVNVVVTVTRTGGAASSVTVDYATSDNTALASTNYTATSGTLTFAANQTSLTFSVPVLNDAGATGDVVADLTLSNALGGGVLGARSTAQLKILDNQSWVRLSAATYSVTEGGSASIAVERGGPAGLPGTVVVTYSTSDGTGVAGTDYRTTTGNLTFGAGVSRLTFSVPTIGNVTQDGNRTFNVAVAVSGGTAGAVVVPATTALVTIVDNDVAGALNFFGTPYHSSESGSVNLSVRRAANAVAGPVTVAYTTVDGTAVAGVDYVAKSGVLTFAPGVTVANFSVSIIPNTLADGTRTFTVVLSPPTGGATLGAASTGTVMIANDDVGGTIQFSAASFSATECAALPCFAKLTVKRTGGGASGVSVDFTTADGADPATRAVAGVDYTATAGTLIFAASQTSQTIMVPLLIEPGAQPTKIFSVGLSNALGGAGLGLQSTANVSIIDTR